MIESTIGNSLEWNPNSVKRDKVIGVYRDADLSGRELWDEHLKWMVDTTRTFRNVFGPRVKGMDISMSVNDQGQTSDETSL